MPRRPRISAGGIPYHVINRRVARQPIFDDDLDYLAMEKALAEAAERWPGVRILAYCLMPNHWHLLLLPRRDGELSRFMQWLTVTHMRRWHAHCGSSGDGPLYQGRFKSFPIQQDDHFLSVARYIERNPLRAKLVPRAADWKWSSLHRRRDAPTWLQPIDQWPVPASPQWEKLVEKAQSAAELAALQTSLNRGAPFGDNRWQKRTAAKLCLESTLRSPWRPKKSEKLLKAKNK